MHTKSTTCTQYIRTKREYKKVSARLTSEYGGSIINEQQRDMIYKYNKKSTCLTKYHTCKHAYNTMHSGNVNMHATNYGSSTQRYQIPLTSSPPISHILTLSPFGIKHQNLRVLRWGRSSSDRCKGARCNLKLAVVKSEPELYLSG